MNVLILGPSSWAAHAEVRPQGLQLTYFQKFQGTSLAGQWVRLRAPDAGGLGSIPGRGTRSRMHATTKSSHATTKKPACRD